MSSPPKPTIAIFGATGGTGLAVLKNVLAAGYSVNVLLRTPSKLSELSAQYLDLLNVVQGDVHDLASIKQALTPSNRRVDIVISSIGMVLERKGVVYVSGDPNLCEVGTRNITTALSELEAEIDQTRPPSKLIIVSSTGVSEQRDLPLAVVPFYRYVLATPRKDKGKMEAVVTSLQRPWVIVRPSLLLDGPAKGLSNVRVGTEIPSQKNQAAHAIGYTIRRDDVGLWIFEECISNSERWENWVGKCVSLTY